MARNFCETMTWTGTNEKGLIQQLQIYLHFDPQIYKIQSLLTSVLSTWGWLYGGLEKEFVAESLIITGTV